jgi:hypothetical protein
MFPALPLHLFCRLDGIPMECAGGHPFPVPISVLHEQFGVDHVASNCLGCAYCTRLNFGPSKGVIVCLRSFRRHIEGELCRDFAAA